MNIFSSQLYEKQLKEILQKKVYVDFDSAQKFKTYLDAIIINIPTKINKYKKSIYFDDINIKDIEYNEYTIVFYLDNNAKDYIILAIFEKQHLPQ